MSGAEQTSQATKSGYPRLKYNHESGLLQKAGLRTDQSKTHQDGPTKAHRLAEDSVDASERKTASEEAERGRQGTAEEPTTGHVSSGGETGIEIDEGG